MKRSLWVDKGQEERRKKGEGEPDAGPTVEAGAYPERWS